MIRALTVALAIFLASGSAPAKTRKPKPAAFVQSAAPAYQFSFASQADAENQLLSLANQVRAEAGVPPLQWDEGLTRAAREHAATMAGQQQLSHQFSGEASVHQRLTAATPLHLDRAGENVAYAATVEEVHDNLMHSPPHRENLLNPAYNLAGFGVVRSGVSLYVVQDFGHGSQINTSQQAENMAADSVMRMRERSNGAPLQRLDGRAARAAACSMAQADSLNVSSNPGQYFLRYTIMQPETTRQKQSQTVAYAHLRWGLVIRGRSAIPAGCIGLRWFFIDSRVRPRFTHALLERAQPQRLKPIEFWPNGTTEVVPFPKHWAATFGVHELARLFTGENAVGCQLTAIAIEGPRRGTSSR